MNSALLAAQEFELQSDTLQSDITRIVLVIIIIALLINAVRLAYARNSNAQRNALISIGLAILAILIATNPDRVIDIFDGLFNRYSTKPGE